MTVVQHRSWAALCPIAIEIAEAGKAGMHAASHANTIGVVERARWRRGWW